VPKRPAKKKRLTPPQILLGIHLAELGFLTVTEHKFCADRDWRFDRADLVNKVGYECDGGKRTGGHRRGDAIDDENEKINTATLNGWRVIKFTNEFVLSGEAKNFLARWL
jgi:hypothetical protein